MSGRDNQNWLRMWRNEQTEFHQQAVNPLLIRFWGSLGLKKPSRVFVPLCGKSLDLLWLAQQGHEVVGVELSPLAVEAFFEENHLTPNVHRRKGFTEWEHGGVKILCGDFFGLNPADLGQIDVVYDRAALTALPEQVRKRYVAHMRQIVPLECTIFLLTIEDGNQVDGVAPLSKAAGEIDEEIQALYGTHFEIQVAHTEADCDLDCSTTKEANNRDLRKVYRLRPKA